MGRWATGARRWKMDLFANASAIIANHSAALNETNGTIWLTHEEVEHFLGDPDVDHGLALVLGAISIVYGRRLPQLLAGVASLSVGLWTGLIIQDKQVFGEPIFGKIDLPEGAWVPLLAGVLAGVAASVLCKVAWRTALVLLTAGLVMLLALATCRLANLQPDKIFSVGASLLSAYRIVGSVVMVLAILGSAFAVRRVHKYMIEFASAFLGTLLLLSGVSHFATRVGNDAPFSLLDDLARIISEVRSEKCHLWEHDEAHHLEKCDCEEKCQTEIGAWLASSGTVLLARWFKTRLIERSMTAKSTTEEERAPLSREVAIAASPSPRASPASSPGGPSPQVVGAGTKH